MGALIAGGKSNIDEINVWSNNRFYSMDIPALPSNKMQPIKLIFFKEEWLERKNFQILSLDDHIQDE